MKNFWLENIYRLHRYIFKLKIRISNYGILATLYSLLYLVVLELSLAIVSLPLYFSNWHLKSTHWFGEKGISYIGYRARRRITLSSFSGVMVFALAFLFYANFVMAAVITWDNDSTDGLWDTCANWVGDSCPGVADIATFDGTNTDDVTINGPVGVLGIDINSGYTGTITQASTLTIGATGYDQADGTFVGSADNIDINGDYTLSAGTFFASRGTTYFEDDLRITGGTFNANGGIIEFDGASTESLIDLPGGALSINNLNINKSGVSAYLYLNTGDTLTVTNTAQFLDGAVWAFSPTGIIDIDLCQNTTFYSQFGANNSLHTGQIHFNNGNGSGSITVQTTSTLPAITLADSNCSLDLAGTGTTTFYGDTTFTTGTINVNNSAVYFDGTVDLAGATYNGGSGAEGFSGAVTMSSGDWDFGSGIVDFEVAAVSTFSGANVTSTSVGEMNINADFALSGGSFVAPTGTMFFEDDLRITGGTFNPNGGTIEFDGASPESFIDLPSGGLSINNFNINKTFTNAYLYMNSNDTLTVTNTAQFLDGYIWGFSPTGIIEVDLCQNTTIGSNFGGNNSHTGQLHFIGGSGSVSILEGAGLPSVTFNAPGCSLDLTGTATTTFNGTTSFTSGTINTANAAVYFNNTLNLNGATYNGGSGAEGFANVVTMSSGDWDFGSGIADFRDAASLTISGANVTSTSVGEMNLNGTFTISNGNFVAPTGTMFFEGNITISGGNFNPNGGTWELDGSSSDNTINLLGSDADANADFTINNLNIRKESIWSVAMSTNDILAVTGTLSLLDGLLYFGGTDNTTIEARGDILQSSNYTGANTGRITIGGSADQVFYGDSDGSVGGLPPIVVNKSGGTLTLGGGVSTTLRVDKGWTYVAGNVDPASSTVYFIGATNLDGEAAGGERMPFGDVRFNSGNVTLTGDLDVNGDLNILGGQIIANGNDIYVAGDWNHSSGDFNYGVGTVYFDGGTQTISASSSFYNFNFSTSSAATLIAPASVTTTFNGSLTLAGAAGNLLSVSSSLSGTQTYFYPLGSHNLSYLNVEDNYNVSTTELDASDGTTLDSGNNTNWDFGNEAPTSTITSVAQRITGTGLVDIAVEFFDANGDDTGQIRVDYRASTDCSTGTSDPTLDETDESTTASFGDPNLENDNTYQIGDATGYVLSSSGANTINFIWPSATDVPTADGTYCLLITPTDSIEAGTGVSTTFTLDNVDPTAPGDLTLNSIDTDSITLGFASSTTDTNFKEYKIYYTEGSAVDIFDTSYTSSTDSNLGQANFGGASTTTITGLSANTQYSFTMWALDTFGNSTTISTDLSAYSAAYVPSKPSASVSNIVDVTVSWGANGNPAGTEYYVEDANDSATNSGWLSGTSHQFTGLNEGTAYTFRVKARNGDNTETTTVSVNITTESQGGGGAGAGAGSGSGSGGSGNGSGGSSGDGGSTGSGTGSDTGTGDTGSPDSGTTPDTGESETTTPDTGVDTSQDSGTDTGESTTPVDTGDTDTPDTTTTEAPDVATTPDTSDTSQTTDTTIDTSIPADSSGETVESSTDGGSAPAPIQIITRPIISQGTAAATTTKQVVEAVTETVTLVTTPASAVTKVIEVVREISKEPKRVLEETLAKTAEVVQAAEAIADNPEIEEAVQKVVAPTAAGISVTTVAVSMGGNVMSLLKLLFFQPMLLLGVQRRKGWGVVYNSTNKLPIDLAIVRLVNVETNKLVQSRVTDAEGRYMFQPKPGMYRLEVSKNGYEFPSNILQTATVDGGKLDLYHGDTLEVKENSGMVTPNIPVDPADTSSHTPTRIIRQKYYRTAQHAVALTGIATTGVSLYINPSWPIAGFMVLHVGLFGVFKKFALPKKPKRYGQIVDKKTKLPVTNAIVRLYTKEYNKLVDTKVTNNLGDYAFLVGPSKYFVTVKHPYYKTHTSSTIQFEDIEKAFIVRDIELESMFDKENDQKINKQNGANVESLELPSFSPDFGEKEL